MEVKVKKNNIEFALRLLKRKIKDSGLMVELRERQYYTKRSDKRQERLKKRRLVIKRLSQAAESERSMGGVRRRF